MTTTTPSATSHRRTSSTTRRCASAVLVAIAVTLGATVIGAAPASAHARCDGQTHDHYYLTANPSTWRHLYYVRQHNRSAPDVTWAVARSSSGETHMNRCLW